MDDRTAKRKAAAKRARDRRTMVHPTRDCEDCGTPIDVEDRAFDPVLCWACLQLLNGNQRAGRPRLSVHGGDAA